eukprot:TRINITY_DN6322_c0_g1_i1.p1 TRINITY_DN6322_c0_g1~~TRINITY_DN6322_c0_g1_i1.p1  ORF type:complete len:652 (-),score=98.30 TRINITY_DN6322_c0_g1_i1:24-1979(-)
MGNHASNPPPTEKRQNEGSWYSHPTGTTSVSAPIPIGTDVELRDAVKPSKNSLSSSTTELFEPGSPDHVLFISPIIDETFSLTESVGEERTPTFAEPEVVKDEQGVSYLSGWLQKQTVQRGNIKARAVNNSVWQNRLFVLKPGCLYYYTVKTEETFQNVDKISVACESSKLPIVLNTQFFGYPFTISFEGHSVRVAATSEEELESWLEALKKPNVTKEGWLVHQHPTKKHWMLKYFEIAGGKISYSHRSERGFIPLAGCTVDSYSTVNGFGFSIISAQAIMNLCADSEETRQDWLVALGAEIRRLSSSNSEKITDRPGLELSYKLIEALERAKADSLRRSKDVHRKDPSKFYILSIDGGGMRGIVTTIILERLCSAFPDLIPRFDCFTGCSNGSMVAMGLACDYDPRFCRSLLEITGNIIFKSGTLTTKMNSAKFRNAHLKLLCDTIWQSRKMKECRAKVLIPGFLMDNRSPDPKKRSCEAKSFHNFGGEDESEEKMSECIMKSIMAPTFFPSYQGYVDGGLFAHDPSSLALSMVLGKLNKRPDEICVLSLGTGRVYHHYDDPSHDWGYVQWVPKLTNCFWDGMLMKTEMLCRNILGDRYHRLDPTFDKEISMDDPMQIPILTELAKNVDLSDTILWIQTHLYSEKYSEEE